MSKPLDDLLESFRGKPEDGHRYQGLLYKLIRDLKPLVAVETGVDVGVSTANILKALEDNGGEGHLYSIDPAPKLEFEHPQWTLIKSTSIKSMRSLYGSHRPWNFFLHDSDHGVGCQTFEYELAWQMLPPGGVLCSDDITWAGHGAWDKFLARHKLNGRKLGHAGMVEVEKINWEPLRGREVLDAEYNARTLACNAANEFGDKDQAAQYCLSR